MNGDITPKKPDITPNTASQTPLAPPTDLPPVTLDEPAEQPPAKRPVRRIVLIALSVVAALLLAGVVWYTLSLRPANSSDKQFQRVEIASGSSPSQIADELETKGLIRSSTVFELYTRLARIRGSLQAGVYSFSPSQSTATIASKLAGGDIDNTQFDITFYPGGTLEDKTSTDKSKKLDARTVLGRAGFSDEQITAAFNAQYDHPLLAGRPDGASLEGYLYGDTYRFNRDATVGDILTRSFDEFYQVVQQYDLTAKFKKQGLTLYQGITLASIIQREVGTSDPNTSTKDQKQVAQVFYLRLKKDMPLGSDVTAYYGADQAGVERSVSVDTPYNTRLHKGLPPGPIGTPGLGALLAVANPAQGDYLYFLTGDDGKTYFAHTNDEHEENIHNHCQKGCSVS